MTIIGLPPNKDGWRDLFGGPGHMPSPSFWAALACYIAIGLRFFVFVWGRCFKLPSDKTLEGYMQVETNESRGDKGQQNSSYA